MKIAVPSRDGKVDSHFGHCEYFTVFSLNEQGQICDKEILTPPPGCGCKSNIVSRLVDLDVGVLLAGNMGQGAVNKLSAAGIRVIRGCSGPVNRVVEDYAAGNCTDAPILCHDHGSCPEH
jgi:predicted Fe-Mo cluster-binding NifX family protein